MAGLRARRTQGTTCSLLEYAFDSPFPAKALNRQLTLLMHRWALIGAHMAQPKLAFQHKYIILVTTGWKEVVGENGKPPLDREPRGHDHSGSMIICTKSQG